MKIHVSTSINHRFPSHASSISHYYFVEIAQYKCNELICYWFWAPTMTLCAFVTTRFQHHYYPTTRVEFANYGGYTKIQYDCVRFLMTPTNKVSSSALYLFVEQVIRQHQSYFGFPMPKIRSQQEVDHL